MDATTTAAAHVPRKPVTAPFILQKATWALALALMALFALEGYFSFEIQTGAPQQAAAAAWACFQIVTPYVIARAIDELLKGQQS